MKIDNISQNIGQIENLDSTTTKPADKEITSGTAVPEKVDQQGTRVDFSNTSVEFSRAAEKMDKVLEDRMKKIEDLKKEIKDDTYYVDSKEIAEKIIDDTLSNILEP